MMTDMDKKIVAAALIYAIKKPVSILNNDDVIKSMNMIEEYLEGCRAKVFHTG